MQVRKPRITHCFAAQVLADYRILKFRSGEPVMMVLGEPRAIALTNAPPGRGLWDSPEVENEGS
jgi:hypothetical protein